MDHMSLHEKLEQLHRELEHTQSVDESDREYLQHLMRDIQAILGESGRDKSSHYPSLTRRLTEAVGRLEESHPQLTLTIGQVLDHLAQV